jgi:hypothetical protein
MSVYTEASGDLHAFDDFTHGGNAINVKKNQTTKPRIYSWTRGSSVLSGGKRKKIETMTMSATHPTQKIATEVTTGLKKVRCVTFACPESTEYNGFDL